ncbi:YkgJ family cysteine cluster protein [Cetobacterium sp.]|uniref:YkgJ family cysteine cluster protein n=1 Tax=Cetobacterium sp. TaxID=2071632 RepID=UPI003F3F804E
MTEKIIATPEEMAKDMLSGREMVVLCDKNGNCNGCKDCCTLMTSILKKEFDFLKKKVSKKHLRQYVKNQLTIQNQGKDGIDISCFFHIDGKCSIYNVRPIICKKFHCRADLNENYYEAKLYKEIYFLFELLPKEWQTPYINVLKEAKKLIKDK